jgi:hypothetical protein
MIQVLADEAIGFGKGVRASESWSEQSAVSRNPRVSSYFHSAFHPFSDVTFTSGIDGVSLSNR